MRSKTKGARRILEKKWGSSKGLGVKNNDKLELKAEGFWGKIFEKSTLVLEVLREKMRR